MRKKLTPCFFLATLGFVGFVRAQDALEGIRPTPLTRPELKRLLEDVKVRVPRIPLPELTDGDRAKLGTQADSYESRVKYHYLNGIEPVRNTNSNAANLSAPGAPGSANAANTANIGGASNRDRSAGFSRLQDPLFTLDNALKVELFWIVSRVNNCQYCIGHQESKLLGLGRSEDQIALLDSDWKQFDVASQTAFAFAKKFTLEPHLFSDADIAGLQVHFTDDQILEMVLSMAGNNSINRWKEAIAVPQNKDEGGFSRVGGAPANNPIEQSADAQRPRGSYLTPTSPAFEKTVSKIVVLSETSDVPNTCATVSRRPALESRDFVEKMLLECKTRKPRIPLMDELKTRENIPGTASMVGQLPNWVRLLARFPTAGSSRFDSILASEDKGDISPLLKAQLSWILARQDRAWYALARARDQLSSLDQSTEQIFALDGDWSSFSAREQALFRIAKNLGNAPVVLSATEVKEGIEAAGARDVVQVISFTTSRAAFNRITEAFSLPLDPAGGLKKVDPIPVTRDNVFGGPPPGTKPTDAQEDDLTPAAEAIVQELRASLPKDSEAIAMLEGILDGSRLSAEDGWFKLSKAQNRFGWNNVRKRFDTDQDDKVIATEFAGGKEDFSRLDRNDDGQLTESDFDWSKHSLTVTPGFMMFFMADRDANGKLTREEFLNLFEQLGADEDGYLAIDDLREKFLPPTPSESVKSAKRPDEPSRSTLLAGLKNQELGSLQPGPSLDEQSPDFTLTTLDGQSVTLSKEIGEKPIVLIFGNFTCGPFRSQAGNIEKLYERYQDRAKFFLVYVREAHPSDGWWMTSNQRAGIDLSQPKMDSERRLIARTCQKHLDIDIPFLVDGVDDAVGSLYSGMPNRLYLIDQTGRIAFKNGRGPFGFHPRQLEQSLVLLLNDKK